MQQIKLNFSETLTDSVSIGLKNAASIVGCLVLWLLTIWIPYINVGTTIAICTLPIELSKGKIISPLAIFDEKYRKYMGEFFLAVGFMYIPILLATMFMFIPGIILSIAWSLTIFLVLDKGMNPAEAISASNKATYGNKVVMFLLTFLVMIVGYTAIFVFTLIPFVGAVLAVLGFIVLYAIMIALQASFYRQLTGNIQHKDEEPNVE